MKILFSALLLTILILSVVIPAYGQDDVPLTPPTQDIRFTHITRDDGLSHMRVYAIVQDQAGFLWIGTQDGLNRYDGYDFVVYKPDYENPSSLGDRYVSALLVAQAGEIWIGTELGGLDRYDPVTQTLSHYQPDPNDPKSLTSGKVFSIIEDRSGIIWVGTKEGLSSLDPTSGEITRYLHNPDDQTSISHNGVNAVHEDKNGGLWFGTDGGGLDTLDRNKGEFNHYKNDPDDPDSLCHDRVRAIAEDNSGLIWIGSNGGLNAFNPKTGSTACYKHDPDDPGSLGSSSIRVIYEDSQGVLWVGTSGGGLNQFDRENGEFIRYQHDPLNPTSLTNDRIQAIFEDQGGILWIGTQGGGLDKFDRSQQRFTRIKHEPGNSNSLYDNTVVSVFEGKGGVIWIGTPDGLNKFDRSSGEFTLFQNDPLDPNSISTATIRTIFEDNEGVLWIGTTGAGLNRFDPAAEDFRYYRHDPEDTSSISSDTVISIYGDREGALWIGTNDGGLNRFDRHTESFQTYWHNPDDLPGIDVNHINIVYEDQSGLLWLGTLNGGLNWFDRETEQFGVIRHDPDDPESLSSDFVRAIYQDKNGIFWVGTPSGLNKINFHDSDSLQDKTIQRFTGKNGLPSDVIEGILEDDQGYLWISTSAGISRFDPQTESFKNFTAAHGLSGDEFYRAVAVKLSSGEMLFGGSAGLTLFAPDEITENPYIPPIQITDLKLLNRSVEIGGDSPLQQSVWETDQLTLSHQDDILTFEFAALSYANPSGNQYQYMLQGFDDQWSPVGDKRSATYTNLDPGDYVFHVRGSNSDGVWNEEGTSIQITITPPWWGTLWFRGALVVLLVAGLFGAYRWRIRTHEIRSQVLETQVAEQTRQLDNRVKELDTLLAVSQDVTSTLHLEPLLELILDELKKVVDYDVGTIRRLVQENMELLAHRWLYSEAGQPSQLLPISNIPIVQEMIQTQQAILVADHQFDPGIVGDTQLYRGNLTGDVLQASRTLMCVPMVLKDEIIGMVVLGHHQPNYWGEEVIELVQAFANQAAVAIINAELFEKAGEAATLEERTRLARDLHDSATQSLYSATLFSEAGKELAAAGDLESAEHYLTRVGEVVYQALKDMRLLVFQLRPPLLEKEGLVMALQHRLDAVEKRAGVDARLISDQLPSLSSQVSEELYNIAIEALNNTLKHAQADKITITIRADNRNVNLEVRDDGQGFDTETARNGGGMGLGNMAERAEKIGADLTIESSSDQGTSIRVIVPSAESPSKLDRHTESKE